MSDQTNEVDPKPFIKNITDHIKSVAYYNGAYHCIFKYRISSDIDRKNLYAAVVEIKKIGYRVNFSEWFGKMKITIRWD